MTRTKRKPGSDETTKEPPTQSETESSDDDSDSQDENCAGVEQSSKTPT